MSTTAPFFFQPDAKRRSREAPEFGFDSFSKHLEVINASALGHFLLSYVQAQKIDFKICHELPAGVTAQYSHSELRPHQSHILYGGQVNALSLACELRRCWQFRGDVAKSVKPVSVEEYVTLRRFTEADIKAWEFGVAMQAVHVRSLQDTYSGHMIACMDNDTKRLLEYDVERLMTIAGDSGLLRQAMRQVFDNWIAHSPSQNDDEKKIKEEIEILQSRSGISSLFSKMAKPNSLSKIKLRKQGIRANFMAELAQALGATSAKNEGNYLTGTEGAAWLDPLYTQICSYHLEDLAVRDLRKHVRRHISWFHL
jgi:hypothetical protein